MARRDALLRLHKSLVARGTALRKALAGELADLRFKTTDTEDSADAAFDAGSEEVSSQLAELEARELSEIARALARIKQGTYGSCELCQAKIPVARLNILPYSTTCVKCQREMESDLAWDETTTYPDYDSNPDASGESQEDKTGGLLIDRVETEVEVNASKPSAELFPLHIPPTPENAVRDVPQPSLETNSRKPIGCGNARHSLRVFLCYSHEDEVPVRQLYDQLRLVDYNPWFDQENLIPGQSWESEIKKAVRNCDVVIVCLSCTSISKTGFVQKEIKYALDVAEERPEGKIFLIPLKLEECQIPERLARWHCVKWFESKGCQKLMDALRICADQCCQG